MGMENWSEGLKHFKLSIILVTIITLSGLIMGSAYISGGNVFSAQTSQSLPQVEILSPEQNGTYQTTNVPLNITANNATAKIAYNLDGTGNVTFNENATAIPSLTKGAHNLTIYAFDNEGNVGDCKSVTFDIDIPYPPDMKLTMGRVQEVIAYFEAKGLEVRILDTSKPQNCLYADSVVINSKEALADCAIAKGINVIYEVLDLNANYIGFNVNYYNNSPLPTVYCFSATLY
jgi:hypothetical protein